MAELIIPYQTSAHAAGLGSPNREERTPILERLLWSNPLKQQSEAA